MLKLLRPASIPIVPTLASSRLACLGLARPSAIRYFSQRSQHFPISRQQPPSNPHRKYSSSAPPPPPPQPKISIFQRLQLAASFSFYSAIVLGGIGLLGLVIYYFVSEVLLPTSDVQLFNKTFSIIKKDPECQRILGTRMQAHGESTGSNKWARSRPVASRRGFDNYGREHLWMQFHVEGELITGDQDAIVRLEMVRDPHGSNTFEYRYLVLEAPHQPRLYLIDNTPTPALKDKSTGFLGVKWGKKD